MKFKKLGFLQACMTAAGIRLRTLECSLKRLGSNEERSMYRDVADVLAKVIWDQDQSNGSFVAFRGFLACRNSNGLEVQGRTGNLS